MIQIGVEPVDCVRAAEQKQEEEEESKSNTIIASDMTTTMTAADPWMLFLYALKAPATRDKYIQRLTKFLDFLGYTGTKEEKAQSFG